MAEAFARHHGAEAYSAGSKPSGKVNSDAIKVMQEIGIDISSNSSKGFNELPKETFDYVITMGCHDTCPFIPAKKNIEWTIEDPKDRDIEFFRKIRDEIGAKIKEFLGS